MDPTSAFSQKVFLWSHWWNGENTRDFVLNLSITRDFELSQLKFQFYITVHNFDITMRQFLCIVTANASNEVKTIQKFKLENVEV